MKFKIFSCREDYLTQQINEESIIQKALIVVPNDSVKYFIFRILLDMLLVRFSNECHRTPYEFKHLSGLFQNYQANLPTNLRSVHKSALNRVSNILTGAQRPIILKEDPELIIRLYMSKISLVEELMNSIMYDVVRRDVKYSTLDVANEITKLATVRYQEFARSINSPFFFYYG